MDKYIKSVLLILIPLSLLIHHCIVKADAVGLRNSLPVECDKVPDSNEHLCFIITQSAYGPYDDVVFYHKNSNGNLILLGSQKDGVATFGGAGFSTGGTYMWLSWAEEGHPHFEFYLTQNFLENGLNARILKVLGDYYFSDFEKFTDAGEVVYELNDGAYEDCNKAGKEVSYKIDPQTSEKRCLKTFRLSIL